MRTINAFVFATRPHRSIVATIIEEDDGAITLVTTLPDEISQTLTAHPDHPLHPYLAELIATLHEAAPAPAAIAPAAIA